MIRVNLLATPVGAAPKQDFIPREQRSAAIGLVILVATGISVFGWWWFLRHERGDLDTKITSAQSELTRLKNVAALVDRAAARKAELTERLALIDRLRSVMKGPVSLLETVSSSLPEGLWLTDFKQTGAVVQIEGRAISLTSVTDFTEQMQNSGMFKRPVEIVTTTTETVEDTAVIRFIVKGESTAAQLPDDPTPAKPGTPGAKPGMPPAPGAKTSSGIE
jgi:Tfp pilus assembly protein PilN